MHGAGAEAVQAIDLRGERLGNEGITIAIRPTALTVEVDVSCLLRPVPADYAVARLGVYHEALLFQQLQGAVDRGHVEMWRPVLDALIDLRRGDVARNGLQSSEDERTGQGQTVATITELLTELTHLVLRIPVHSRPLLVG
jgi:hypothetical protein